VRVLRLWTFRRDFTLLDLNRIHSIGPESLASIPIPSTDCKLGARVFRRCRGLRSVTLPETLEIIEDRMFDECISPTHIEIPPTVAEIGVATFLYCKAAEIAKPVYERIINELVDCISVCGDDNNNNNKNNNKEDVTIEFAASKGRERAVQ
jgi:hypothetical protein